MKKIIFILIVISVLIHNSLNLSANTNRNNILNLQVEVLLSVDNQLITSREDVTLKLTNLGEVVWIKTYENKKIDNGRVQLDMSGLDNNSTLLTPQIFDENDNLELTISVGSKEVRLDFINQPYSIKSKISNVSHDTEALQGIPIRKVDEVENGSVLGYVNGSWAPISVAEPLSTDSGTVRVTSIGDESDVSLDNIVSGDILVYDGSFWTNGTDRTLNATEINEIVGKLGYLTEVTGSAIAGGTYDNIEGIGGVITITTNPTRINEKTKVLLTAEMFTSKNIYVMGSLGTTTNPVPSINIEKLVLLDGDDDIYIENDAGVMSLKADSININNKSVDIMSGEGKVPDKGSLIAVYDDTDEIGYHDDLIWYSVGNLQQLAIGAVEDDINIGLNIATGGIKMNGNLTMLDDDGSEVLLTAEDVTSINYVIDTIKTVAYTNDYLDLDNRIDLSSYVSSNTFLDTLEDYYDYIADSTANQTAINSAIEIATSNLYNQVTEDLESYYTSDEVDTKISENVIDTTEYLTASDLENYATKNEIETMLVSYVLEESITDLAKTADWSEILNTPNLVSAKMLKLATQDIYLELESNYIDSTTIESQIQSATDNLKDEIYTSMNENMVLLSTLKTSTDNLYDNIVGSLSQVATSGSWEYIINTPNFVLETELITSLNEYVLEEYLTQNYYEMSDFHTIAISGSYNDLSDTPDLSEYVTYNYLTDTYVSTYNLEITLDDYALSSEVMDKTWIQTNYYSRTETITQIEDYIETGTSNLYTTITSDIASATSNLYTTITNDIALATQDIYTTLADDYLTTLNIAAATASIYVDMATDIAAAFSTDNVVISKNLSIGTSITDEVLVVSGNMATNGVRFKEESQSGSSTSGTTIDWNDSSKQYITLDGYGTTTNVTFINPNNATNNVTHLILVVEYSADDDAVEFDDYDDDSSLTYNVLWPGGVTPELSGDSGQINILSFYYRYEDATPSGNYYGNASFDYD